MDGILEDNKAFLSARFPAALESFRTAGPLPGRESPQFLIPLPNGQTIDMLVDVRVFLGTRAKRLKGLPGSAGGLVWGVESPEELVAYAEQFAGTPFLYIESDPVMFDRILRTISLRKHLTDPRAHIVFASDCGQLMAHIALVFAAETAVLPRIWIDVAPSLLVKMLDDRHPLGSFVSVILENVYLNQSEDEKIRRQKLFEKGIRNLSALFPPDYLYEALVRWLGVYLVATPGIRSLYSNMPAKVDWPSVRPVSIVILAWNRWDLTEKCLRSILHYPIPAGTEIIVVDNGSSDLTPFALRRLAESVPIVKPLRLETNRGPAGGRQEAASVATGKTLIFLDNDVQIKHARWMDILLEPLAQHPRVGSAGAFGVIHTSDQSETWTQKILFPGMATPVNWLSSFCVAIRANALRDCGGWRPDLYHLYGMEDVAMGYALRAAEWISVAPGQFVPVSHGMNHKDGHYDYDFNATGQKNTESFKRMWGERHRILNLARGNKTLAPVTASSSAEQNAVPAA